MAVAINHKSAIALLLLLTTIGGMALIPHTVKAIVPVSDLIAIGKLILQLGELISQTAEAIFQSGLLSSLVIKEYVLDPAVKLLASLMLQVITRAIIGWIQSGGNTNFISNLQAAMNRTADEAAGEFLNQLARTNLCEPFSFRLRLVFQVPTLRDRLSCTATDIFKNLQTSYEEFLADFTRGGWLVFQTALSGSNNYIDALINSYDAKLRAESRRVSVLQNQYIAGQGFVGIRIKKPDCSGIDVAEESQETACPMVDVQTTPGKLVGEQLSRVFNSGIDQAVNADEIAEAIDVIIVALIQKLISSAQAGLLANDESSGIYDSGFSSPAPLPTPPPFEGVSILDDIKRIDTALGADVAAVLGSATSTIAAIDAAIQKYGSTTPPPSQITLLKNIKTRLTQAQTLPDASRQKLLAWKSELQEISQKLRTETQATNPDHSVITKLAARARRINVDLTAEINDVIPPDAEKIRSLKQEADRLILELQQQYPNQP